MENELLGDGHCSTIEEEQAESRPRRNDSTENRRGVNNMRFDRRSLDKLTPCDALKVIDYDIREAEDTLVNAG